MQPKEFTQGDSEAYETQMVAIKGSPEAGGKN